MHSQKTEEDIYDFSGVSYDLTSLRSELMQFREKGKPATTDRFRSEETLRNDISEKYNNYVLPSSSSILSRSYGSDSQPPKLPPKEKDLNRQKRLRLNVLHKSSDKMIASMDGTNQTISDIRGDCATTVNKNLGFNYQINEAFVNNVTNGHQDQNYINMNDYNSYNNNKDDEDDEEWYPPSPPIYDVADKLIEINRMLYDDPAALIRNGPGKLRWKPDSYLVQVRWLYAGGDSYDEDYEEHYFDDPDQHDQDLDDYSDDCDHEPSPPPPSLKLGGYTQANSSTALNTANGQTFIENFGKQLNLAPMSTNHNPSPPIMDSYGVDSDEKSMSPNVISPLPSDRLINNSNNAVSDSYNGPMSATYNDETQYNDDFEYSKDVNDTNIIENDLHIEKDRGEDQSSGYGSNGVKSENSTNIENNCSDMVLENHSSTVDINKRKISSPNKQYHIDENRKAVPNTVTKINTSEDDESISCKTMNGDGDLSNEENLISQRIDLNRQYSGDGRNSTSPSSMSSNLSQHSQSSILNLINTHEAKRAGLNSGKKSNKRISPSNGISIKGAGVSRHVSMSTESQELPKSPVISPSATKTKIMISKNGHCHTKEPNSSSLSNSHVRPRSAKETNSNMVKNNRGVHREKILLNGDSDSSSSRNTSHRRLLNSSAYSPLPPLYHQSSSSPSSTPPPLPEKTLSRGMNKSSSAYSMLQQDGSTSDAAYTLSNGRPKPSLSPYTRSRISKTSSDNSLHQTSKFGQQRNSKVSSSTTAPQNKSQRSSSLSRSATSRTSSYTPSIGLGKRDSFSNRSSITITSGIGMSNDIKIENALANSKRSNSSGLIELKSANRRRSSVSKPPPLPIMTRAAPSTRPLQRKISRNSLSSNSSVSSQTTEDTSATTGSSGVSSGSNGVGLTSTSSGVSSMSSSSSMRRRSGFPSTSSSVNGSGYLDTDSSYLKWKVRKREEKRLKERRDYLEGQLRRY